MKKVKVSFLDKDRIFSSISHQAHFCSEVVTDNGLHLHIPAVIFGMSVQLSALLYSPYHLVDKLYGSSKNTFLIACLEEILSKTVKGSERGKQTYVIDCIIGVLPLFPW